MQRPSWRSASLSATQRATFSAIDRPRQVVDRIRRPRGSGQQGHQPAPRARAPADRVVLRRPDRRADRRLFLRASPSARFSGGALMTPRASSTPPPSRRRTVQSSFGRGAQACRRRRSRARFQFSTAPLQPAKPRASTQRWARRAASSGLARPRPPRGLRLHEQILEVDSPARPRNVE